MPIYHKLLSKYHFSYKTIERGYDRESVNKILDEIAVITNESVEGKEEIFSFDGTGFSASNKENYADKLQKHNSKKSNKKVKSTSSAEKEQVDDSFPKSNLTAKMGFSYAVMGIGVQYKLISGMYISPDHSIGETAMFPEAFGQTLGLPSPSGWRFRRWYLRVSMGYRSGFWKSHHTFYPAVM